MRSNSAGRNVRTGSWIVTTALLALNGWSLAGCGDPGPGGPDAGAGRDTGGAREDGGGGGGADDAARPPVDCMTPVDDPTYNIDPAEDIDVRYFDDVTFAGNGCVHTFGSSPEFYATATFEAGAIVRINDVDGVAMVVGDGGRLILAGTPEQPIDIGPGDRGRFNGIALTENSEPGALQFHNVVIHDSARVGLSLLFDEEEAPAGSGMVMENVVLDRCAEAGISLGCILCNGIPDGAGFTTFTGNEVRNTPIGVWVKQIEHLNLLPSLPTFTSVEANLLSGNLVILDRDVLLPFSELPWWSGPLTLDGTGGFTVEAGVEIVFGVIPDEPGTGAGFTQDIGAGHVIFEGTEAAPIVWDARMASGDRGMILRGAEARLEHVQLMGVGTVEVSAPVNVVDHVTLSECSDDVGFELALAPSSRLTFTNNTIRDCEVGIHTVPENVSKVSASNTYTDVMRLEIGGRSPNVTGATWVPQSVPWTIEDLSIRGDLVLEAGVQLRLANDGNFEITNAGSLTARGTAGAPVTITSVDPAAGGYNVLVGGEVALEHADVSEGNAAFALESGAALTASDSTFHDNAIALRSLSTGTMSLTRSTFSSNDIDISVSSCMPAGLTLVGTTARLVRNFGGPCP